MRKKLIKEFVTTYLSSIIDFYNSIDNSLIIENKKINLARKKMCLVSLRNNTDFYFKFMEAINEYRARIKTALSLKNDLFVNFSDDYEYGKLVNKKIFLNGRLKNINSIFSKIYQYNHTKKEKGEVSINKCLNDLLGFRIIIPLILNRSLLKLIKEIIKENDWSKFKLTDSSKGNYCAYHLYIGDDNYSLKWEIQFWTLKKDKVNRESHALYKQSYTKWEEKYIPKELYQIE